MNDPTVVDLFAGVGGFSLGFIQADYNVGLAVDNHDITLGTYQKNFPNVTTKNINLSDTSRHEILKGTDIDHRNVDIVVGGPPCQGFSAIGNQDPDDDRNDLLIEFAKKIQTIAPRYFILENVRGLMSERVNDYLNQFIDLVSSAGYNIKGPKVLNAANHGIPQKRKRMFAIGYRRGEKEPDFPEPKDSQQNSWAAIKDIPSCLQDVKLENGIYYGSLGEKSRYVERINSWQPLVENVSHGLSGLEPVNHTEKVKNRFSNVKQGEQDDVSRYPRLDKEKPANTLRAGSSRERGTHTPARPIHPESPRCITVREAARLQSFPDWFEFHPTKYHGLRQIGNSVPPMIAKKLAEEIRSCIINDEKGAITND
jgi:DNA (cytosine-5)-methyltransferase 1